MSHYKFVVAISGSIAAYKACTLISKLVQEGHEVKCIATKGALNFLGKASLEGLSAHPVLESTFTSGRMMDHIHLTDWCDAAIIYPATASTINQLDAGFGEGVLLDFYLAFDRKKPLLLAPAMNDRMLLHPKTQHSLKNLQNLGLQILHSTSGFLACRKSGEGRLVEPEFAFEALMQSVAKQSICGRKILLTFGKMEEPVDAVRSLSNASTGKTGLEIAKCLLSSGANVIALAHQSVTPIEHPSCNHYTYRGFKDFYSSMEQLVKENTFDAIIHMAACSDYSIDHVSSSKGPIDGIEKISSSYEELSIHLKRNPKVINMLKSSWGYKGLLVAFKLTVNASDDEIKAKVKALFSASNADYVVHNDLRTIDELNHSFRIYSPDSLINEGTDKSELASSLLDCVVKRGAVS